MKDQKVRLDEIKDALEKYFVETGFSLSQVIREDDGFRSYAAVLEDTTSLLRFYSYAFEDMGHTCVWFDFAVGVVANDQLAKKVFDLTMAINDHLISFRVRTESMGRDRSLVTLLFREDIERVSPDYAVGVVATAPELAAELRQALQIETIMKAKAS